MTTSPRQSIRIIEERCVGCGLCVKACPFSAIHLEDRKAVIDYDACTLCGSCVPVCRKFNAIEMEKAEAAPRKAPEGDVWVFCEQNGGEDALAPVAVELLGLGQELAEQLSVKLVGVLIGKTTAYSSQQAVSYGADRAYCVASPRFAAFDDRQFAAVLARLIREFSPNILLGGATAIGRALLPRVAVMVHTGLTADCTELHIDPETGLLLQTRPAFGGNILATITCEKHRPQMATVRPAVLPRRDPDPGRQGEILNLPEPPDLPEALEWLSFVPRDAGDGDLREAEIIVSAGYGAGGPEGLALVARLAEALGGSLGASRSAVDAGWVPYAHQVGQTGTTVQPKLYIACGISGAIQHIVGMQNSETVVAINRDPEAPIFAYADFAIVGDIFEIIPQLLKQIEAMRGNA